MYSKFLTTSDRDRAITWHIVYAFNLLLPGLLGLSETEGKARLGLLTGVVVFWLVGWGIAARSRLLGTALNWGAVFVGLCQIFLMGHLFLGMCAVSFSKQFELVQHEYSYLQSFLGGLSATSIMGACLMLASFSMGFVVLALSGLATRKPASSTNN